MIALAYARFWLGHVFGGIDVAYCIQHAQESQCINVSFITCPWLASSGW